MNTQNEKGMCCGSDKVALQYVCSELTQVSNTSQPFLPFIIFKVNITYDHMKRQAGVWQAQEKLRLAEPALRLSSIYQKKKKEENPLLEQCKALI